MRPDVPKHFLKSDPAGPLGGLDVDVFGNMAQVWSAYEARTAPGEAPPERRGINSIQLYCEADGRWRIISMIWDNERPGLALPSFE